MGKFDLGFGKKKSTRKVGLDIGTCNLKVVEIEQKSDSSFEITNIGIKDIRQTENVSQAIKELFKEINITTKEVTISVSGENVVARYLSLPKMSEEELKKAMPFELEDHIPFKSDEVYTDYSILGDEANYKNKMKVFLVATKRELVDGRVMTIEEAGLTPRIVTMDALAIKNSFYFNYPDKNKTNIALVNIGEKITNLLITKEQIPYFVRDTKFGGDAITSLIHTKLEMPKNKAEELKQNIKDASSPNIAEIIKSALANLLNEIFVSLDFYENLTEQRIDEVFVSGGSSLLCGLDDFLGGYLGLTIEHLDPFKNFSLSPGISKEKLASLAPFFGVAVGLALEEP